MRMDSAPPGHPQVVTVPRWLTTRIAVATGALVLVVLPTLALLGAGPGVSAPSLVDQQLDGVVQAGSAPPVINPLDTPLPTAATARMAHPTDQLTVAAANGTVSRIASTAYLPGSSRGIPLTVLAAYHHAADLMAAEQPACGIPWWVLAGIGRIESGHAAGGHVDAAGTTTGRILGPLLDGSTPGTAVVADTDHGALDGNPSYDRAVGPMQFLPSTWAVVGADANGDGRADPNNIFDATLGAARYLCAGHARLDNDSRLAAAVLRYNPSTDYVAAVLAWGHAYRDGVTPVGDAAGQIPTAATPVAAATAPPAATPSTHGASAGAAGGLPTPPPPAGARTATPTPSTTTSATSPATSAPQASPTPTSTGTTPTATTSSTPSGPCTTSATTTGTPTTTATSPTPTASGC